MFEIGRLCLVVVNEKKNKILTENELLRDSPIIT
ncbi:MAG: hypothetical protein CM15mP58_08950 [Burkholderiaceae bacterium]|nr:MAG: hypothetical protein CM15mP58_08950 [Burkholderiaceae bacterium]